MADETKLTAATRIEKLLDNIAGGDNDVTPATRLEKFLSYIADAMEGGGGSGGGGTGGNVYNIVPIPEAEFAEGGAFYNVTISGAPVVSGEYIDTDSDVNVGDILEFQYESAGLDVIGNLIITEKNTYVDIPDVGSVSQVILYESDTFANNINTDTGNVSYNGKYFTLVPGGIS